MRMEHRDFDKEIIIQMDKNTWAWRNNPSVLSMQAGIVKEQGIKYFQIKNVENDLINDES